MGEPKSNHMNIERALEIFDGVISSALLQLTGKIGVQLEASRNRNRNGQSAYKNDILLTVEVSAENLVVLDSPNFEGRLVRDRGIDLSFVNLILQHIGELGYNSTDTVMLGLFLNDADETTYMHKRTQHRIVIPPGCKIVIIDGVHTALALKKLSRNGVSDALKCHVFILKRSVGDILSVFRQRNKVYSVSSVHQRYWFTTSAFLMRHYFSRSVGLSSQHKWSHTEATSKNKDTVKEVYEWMPTYLHQTVGATTRAGQKTLAQVLHISSHLWTYEQNIMDPSCTFRWTGKKSLLIWSMDCFKLLPKKANDEYVKAILVAIQEAFPNSSSTSGSKPYDDKSLVYLLTLASVTLAQKPKPSKRQITDRALQVRRVLHLLWKAIRDQECSDSFCRFHTSVVMDAVLQGWVSRKMIRPKSNET